MPLLGLPQAGAVPVLLNPARFYGVTATYAGPDPTFLAKLCAYVDGNGGGSGPQQIAMALFAGAKLLGVSTPVTVQPADGPAWLDFPVPSVAAVALLPGLYSIGLYSVSGSGTVRILAVPPASERVPYAAADTFFTEPVDVVTGTAETATPYTAAGLPFYAVLFAGWAPPEPVDDMYLGRLPWELSQRALGGSAGIPRGSTGLVEDVEVGWHGVNFDEETGAFAIARTGGPVEDLVGQRLLLVRRIGAFHRQAVVYCYAQRLFPPEIADEDISLTRRAFIGLAGWEKDLLTIDILPLPL